MEQDHAQQAQPKGLVDEVGVNSKPEIKEEMKQEEIVEKSAQSSAMEIQNQPQSDEKLNQAQTENTLMKSEVEESHKSILQKRFELTQNGRDRILCNMDSYFKNKLYKNIGASAFNIHSVISKEDQDRLKFTKIFAEMKDHFKPDQLNLTQKQSRGIAVCLGNAIGDALGASTQFQYFNKDGLGIVKTGFKDIEMAVMNKQISPRSGKIAIWTDDNSMALCMADSLLLNDFNFDAQHIRFMFVMWLEHGLNNGGRPYSIGLGGNISISMGQFMQKQTDYAVEGEQFNNGNGSLMRLSPIPVCFSDNVELGMEYAAKQSLTTHNGLEAKECARLMAKIIITQINRNQHDDPKQLLLKVCDEFETPVKSVEFLARGKQQTDEYYQWSCEQNKRFKGFNKSVTDRNWNWREESHTYSKCRNKQQPGYIGSYCMDALAMALHTVLFCPSFAAVVIKNADMGGDCDTVGAIAGQIAGAMYGIDEEMLRLYSEMVDFKEGRLQVFLKGYKLINRRKIPI